MERQWKGIWNIFFPTSSFFLWVTFLFHSGAAPPVPAGANLELNPVRDREEEEEPRKEEGIEKKRTNEEIEK